jgi:hypothetical protein
MPAADAAMGVLIQGGRGVAKCASVDEVGIQQQQQQQQHSDDDSGHNSSITASKTHVLHQGQALYWSSVGYVVAGAQFQTAHSFRQHQFQTVQS